MFGLVREVLDVKSIVFISHSENNGAKFGWDKMIPNMIGVWREMDPVGMFLDSAKKKGKTIEWVIIFAITANIEGKITGVLPGKIGDKFVGISTVGKFIGWCDGNNGAIIKGDAIEGTFTSVDRGNNEDVSKGVNNTG